MSDKSFNYRNKRSNASTETQTKANKNDVKQI